MKWRPSHKRDHHEGLFFRAARAPRFVAQQAGAEGKHPSPWLTRTLPRSAPSASSSKSLKCCAIAYALFSLAKLRTVLSSCACRHLPPPPTARLPGDADGRVRRQKQAQRHCKAVGLGMRGSLLAPAAVGVPPSSYPDKLASPRDGWARNRGGCEEAARRLRGGSDSGDAAKSRTLGEECFCLGLDPDWTVDCRIVESHRKPCCYRRGCSRWQMADEKRQMVAACDGQCHACVQHRNRRDSPCTLE